MFKNVDFRFRETPKTPWERKSCPRDPPRRAPEPALELPGPPRTVPRAPQSPQGPHQIHKVGMLKTLEICVFGTQESKKTVSGNFLMVQVPSREPPEQPPFAPRSPSGAPKASLERPGTPQGPPRPPLGPPRPPQRISTCQALN